MIRYVWENGYGGNVMIRCVWGKGYVGSVMKFIFYIFFKVRILNLIHEFRIFNLRNCYIFVKQFSVISLYVTSIFNVFYKMCE